MAIVRVFLDTEPTWSTQVMLWFKGVTGPSSFDISEHRGLSRKGGMGRGRPCGHGQQCANCGVRGVGEGGRVYGGDKWWWKKREFLNIKNSTCEFSKGANVSSLASEKLPQCVLLCRTQSKALSNHRPQELPRRTIAPSSLDRALAASEPCSELSAFHSMSLILLANPVLQIRRLNLVEGGCLIQGDTAKF